MERRQGLVAIVLVGVAGAAALWLVLRSTAESSRSDVSPRRSTSAGPVARVPGLAVSLPGRKQREQPAESQPTTGSVTGTLVVSVRSSAGASIAAARVVVEQGDGEQVAQTTAEGLARLTVTSGSVDVFVTAERFTGATSKEVEVPEGGEASIKVVLGPGVPFDGAVVDAEDESPIGDADITVSDGGSLDGDLPPLYPGLYSVTHSDADGRFHVPGVADGREAFIEVSAVGHVVGYFGVRVAGGVVAPRPLVLRLRPAGRLVGVVRGPDGAGIEGATVYVQRAADRADLAQNLYKGFPPGGTARTRAYESASAKGGVYVVDGLPPDDEYVAVARADDLALSVVATGLRFSKPTLESHLDFVLPLFASLVVRLVDLDGRPVTQGASVRVADPSGLFDPKSPSKVPQTENVFRLDSLSPGEGRVDVSGPTFVGACVPVQLDAGKTSEVVVHLDPGATVEGTAMDEAGVPLPGALVEIEPVDVDRRSATTRTAETDEQGHFLLRSVDRRPSVVRARGPTVDAGADAATLEGVRVQPPTTDVHLVLVRLGGATLHVRTPDREPFPSEGDASAEPTNGGNSVSGVGSGDGVFRWSGLSAGEYRVRVRVEGFVTIERPLTAHLRGDVDLGEAVLQHGAVVRVGLRDATGRRADADLLLPVRVGSDGKPDLSHDSNWDLIDHGDAFGPKTWRLATGRWQIYATASDSSTPEPVGPPLADWTLAEGETRDVELWLPAR